MKTDGVLTMLLKSLLKIILVLFALLLVARATIVDRMMFHPEMAQDPYTAKSEGYVDIGTNGTTIAAVVLGPKHGKKAILYCHGNGENMYESIHVLRELAKRGFTLAAVDYPGYGLSSGKPTEKGCYRNVHRLYDWLIAERGFAPQDIIVYGFSIGTGSATELAATKKVGGLILEAPFLSAPRVVTQVKVLPFDPFPNADRIERGIACPMLIMHGTDDRVVPFSHGKQLSELSLKGEVNQAHSRDFLEVEMADHGGISGVLGLDAYWQRIIDFAMSTEE